MPLPPPYMCSDPSSFAEHTLVVRLPRIARRMIAENHFPESTNQQINRLVDEIPDQPVRMIDDPLSPDLDLWTANFKDWLGLPWRNLSFLAAEKYFYRRVLEATGYFQPGPTYLLDPYLAQKELGLHSSGTAIRQLARQVERWRIPGKFDPGSLKEAIESNLWSNRADLSIWPVGGENTLANENLHQAEEFLLANDLDKAVEGVINLAPAGKPIHILVDNAGFELVGDLALGDAFINAGLTNRVVYHLKAHPTFVSDALVDDVTATVEFLRNDPDEVVCSFGSRLANLIADQQIQLTSNYFWHAPLAFWDMPETLRQVLVQAGLVITKGDANYRWLTGDRRWPEQTPFETVTAYMPVPLLSLRVAKSDVMVGLAPGQCEKLDSREVDWRTNGRWGLIQYKK